MVIIYDFDGTLTPYSLPQYDVLKKCGYDDEKLMERIKALIDSNSSLNLYEAYYKCYMDILAENEISFTKDNVCQGVDRVTFNKGVVDYFERFQSSRTGVKHYILTSGVQDYVKETQIGKLVDGIFGVTFKYENGKYTEIDTLMSDKKKVDIIKNIQTKNPKETDFMYFGDGLTDKYAFEYMHNIGGTSVFIASNESSETNYKQLNTNGIIDKYFTADFTLNSELSRFMKSQIEQDAER